jgi:hypothetical protein
MDCICVATLRYDSNKTDLLYQEYQMLLQYVSWPNIFWMIVSIEEKYKFLLIYCLEEF